MRDESLSGGFANPPKDAAIAFRAALDVMARPGEIRTLSGAVAPAPLSAAAASLLLTLCDAETPIYLAATVDTPAVRDWISFHIGAPIVATDAAMFALGEWASLSAIADFPIGTPEYPDRSATLIVELPALAAKGARLTGPGIQTVSELNLPEIPYFARNAALFPLGLDFYFTAGTQVAALPRTSKIEEV